MKERDLRLSIKGHNSNMDKTKANAPYQSSYTLTFMTSSFVFKLSVNANIALCKPFRRLFFFSSFDLTKGHQSQYMKTGNEFKNAIFEN